MKPILQSRHTARLLFAWILLSALGIASAPQMVSALLPFFADTLNSMSPKFYRYLKVTNLQGNPLLEITAVIRDPIRVTNTLVIPSGKTFTASIHVLHVMVPIIILFTLLCAWPTSRIQERIRLLLFGIPVNFIILGITIPALLEGHIEMQLNSMIHSAGGVRGNLFLLNWVVFVEMGGLWLFPIIGALACHIAAREIENLSQSFISSGIKTLGKKKATRKEHQTKAISGSAIHSSSDHN